MVISLCAVGRSGRIHRGTEQVPNSRHRRREFGMKALRTSELVRLRRSAAQPSGGVGADVVQHPAQDVSDEIGFLVADMATEVLLDAAEVHGGGGAEPGPPGGRDHGVPAPAVARALL